MNLHIEQFHKPHNLRLIEHLEIRSGKPNASYTLARYHFQRPVSKRWKFWVKWKMGLKRLRDVVHVHRKRIRNEIVPVRKLVDFLAIRGVDIVPAQRRIYRTRAHLMHDLS